MERKKEVSVKRNSELDFWKGIACFGVVFLHCKISNYVLDGVIQSVFRFVIPLFFLISGFFCYADTQELVLKKISPKVKHIGLLCTYSSLLYLFYELAILLIGNEHAGKGNLLSELVNLFSARNLYIWIIWNEDPIIKILWFLFALLYAYLFFYLLIKLLKPKYIFSLAVLLLVCHFILGNLASYLEIHISKHLYRNWLFYATPFFIIGFFIRKNENVIRNVINHRIAVISIFFGMCLSIVEWFMVGRQETYLGSILICVGIFGIALQEPENHKTSLFTRIGNKYSLYIYLVHMIVMVVCNRIVDTFSYDLITEIYLNIRSLIVFAISLFVAAMFLAIKNRVKVIGNE